MSSPQIGRIARLLGVEAHEVHGLDHLADDELRRLHDAISAAIFARYEQRFARIAGLSKALPGAMVGKLAERFLPPTLGARCAEMLEPAKARELVSKVSVRYLADLTLALNPTRSEPVVRAIPAQHIGPVARELFARGEYAAMAEFAGTVNRDALEAALDVATADDLLTIVPLLVWNQTIDEVVDRLPDAKVAELVRDIVASERWQDAGRLIERLHPAKAADLVGRVPIDALVRFATELEPERLGPVVAAIRPETVGEVVRALFDRQEYAATARFVGFAPAASIRAALDVATAHDLLTIVPLLEWNDAIDEVVDNLSDTTIADLVRDIVASERWQDAGRLIERLHPAKAADLVGRIPSDTIAQLVAELDPERVAAVVTAVPLDLIDGVIDALPDERIDALVRDVVSTKAWDEGNTLVERLPAAVLDRALDRADAVGDDIMAEFRAAAARGDLRPAAVALLERAEQRRTGAEARPTA
ncbi:MAG: magnesium transporter MgtE N-terminal domain-containing protein [Jatrophihabitans sp.]|uniref:magnesium transporter MgtE N-terminal domain-containing protein n=1 Tax=Jatrophihabitans sp. TaxID=1932789 RepID=UPI003F7F91CA